MGRTPSRTPSKSVETLMKSFGNRLKALREKRQLSQQELADTVGIHLSQLSRLERGINTPSAETVLALSRVLRVSTDALLRGDHKGEEDLSIGNVRLYERFRALEALGKPDQDTAIKLIDALVAQHRVKQAVAG